MRKRTIDRDQLANVVIGLIVITVPPLAWGGVLVGLMLLVGDWTLWLWYGLSIIGVVAGIVWACSDPADESEAHHPDQAVDS